AARPEAAVRGSRARLPGARPYQRQGAGIAAARPWRVLGDLRPGHPLHRHDRVGSRGRRHQLGQGQAQAGQEIPAAAGPRGHLSGRQDPLDRLSRLRPLRARDRHQSRQHQSGALRSRHRQSAPDDAAAGDLIETMLAGGSPKPVAPHAVKAMLADGEELALIDLREELIFSQNHLLFARSVPLSRLELNFARLVPRRGTRTVLCDDNDDLVERAAGILARAGYTNLHALAGGVAGWAQAGLELFSGVNVPSKAFGEFVEHGCATPGISAEELNGLSEGGTHRGGPDIRPFAEYPGVATPSRVNLP